jgi:hypothetical protein
MKYVLGGMTAVLALVFLVDVNSASNQDKPKYTIKEVMAQAHKSGLLKKVQKGTAEKEDREKLAELYKALAENKPDKGDVDVWKKTTKAMQKLAEDAIADADAGKKLKVACKACHDDFK